LIVCHWSQPTQFPVKSNIFFSLSQSVIAERLLGIFRPGPGLFYQRHPFAEVVDSLYLPLTQPDFNRQPIGEWPGGQDNEVLLRLIVGVYIGDDNLIGVESGSCPVGNGRVDGLAGGFVHEAIALLVSGSINLPVIIRVWEVVVTVGMGCVRKQKQSWLVPYRLCLTYEAA
jgi:hypothetical protein